MNEGMSMYMCFREEWMGVTTWDRMELTREVEDSGYERWTNDWVKRERKRERENKKKKWERGYSYQIFFLLSSFFESKRNQRERWMLLSNECRLGRCCLPFPLSFFFFLCALRFVCISLMLAQYLHS